MRRRAFTLAETMITSAVLLLMIGMAAMVVTGYLRSYRHYTEQSVRLRLAAKTLEAACFRLRSAEFLVLPLPTSLSQKPLRYVERGQGPRSLTLQNGRLVVQELDKDGKVLGSVGLGPALELEPTLTEGFLVLRMRVEGQNMPLETQLSLRGIRR